MKRVLIYFGAIALALASCSKEQEKIMVDGPAVLGLSATGLSEEIVILEPKVVQLEVRIKAETVAEDPVLVTLKADDSLVQAYNQKNGTDYKMPPAGAYSLPTNKLILPSYNTSSTGGKVSLISTGLTDTDTYLLPVTIAEVSGSDDVKMSEESSVIYVVYRKKQLPPAEVLSKKGWNLVYCSSELAENYSGQNFVRSDGSGSSMTGYGSDIIDGDLASIWAYNWKNPDKPPFYIVIDFGREVTVRGLEMYAKRGNKDMMNPDNSTPENQCGQCTLEFATAISGTGMDDKTGGVSDWGYTESFGQADLKNQMVNTVYLTEVIRARYMRLTYEAGYKLVTDQALTNYTGGRLAEINVLGNEEALDLD